MPANHSITNVLSPNSGLYVARGIHVSQTHLVLCIGEMTSNMLKLPGTDGVDLQGLLQVGKQNSL